VGSSGVAALIKVCSAGALPKLAKLALESNPIDETGISALAEAIKEGKLPSLRELSINEASEGLVAACEAKNVTLRG